VGSMSRAPLYFPRGHSYGNVVVQDGILLDGFTDVYDGIHMGVCAENTAERDNISREEQDAFTLESSLPPNLTLSLS
jgi:acetyl-CoA C-acetyltransferase